MIPVHAWQLTVAAHERHMLALAKSTLQPIKAGLDQRCMLAFRLQGRITTKADVWRLDPLKTAIGLQLHGGR